MKKFCLAVALLVMMVALLPAAEQVVNGGFETAGEGDDALGWYSYTTVTAPWNYDMGTGVRSTGVIDAHSGDACALVTCGASGQGNYCQDLDKTTFPTDTDLYVVFYCYLPTGSGAGSLSFSYMHYEGSTYNQSCMWAQPWLDPPVDTWRGFGTSSTLASDYVWTAGTIQIWCNAWGGAGNTAYFDDMSIDTVSSVEDWILY